ncbi:hypothetical protein AT238_07750 [Bartonella henselae]|nr:hypothetical protein AT238_07750 [Bartonella henselae]
MNNPHQWMIRIGGRLTKTVTTTENGRSFSFYGKVNATKTFGEDQTIHIDKDYKLDPMGSFLEGELGISAQLSPDTRFMAMSIIKKSFKKPVYRE